MGMVGQAVCLLTGLGSHGSLYVPSYNSRMSRRIMSHQIYYREREGYMYMYTVVLITLCYKYSIVTATSE